MKSSIVSMVLLVDAAFGIQALAVEGTKLTVKNSATKELIVISNVSMAEAEVALRELEVDRSEFKQRNLASDNCNNEFEIYETELELELMLESFKGANRLTLSENQREQLKSLPLCAPYLPFIKALFLVIKAGFRIVPD